MRKSLILVFVAAGVGLCAQSLPNTLLWRISNGESPAPSYLYGTFHTKNDRAFQFGDSVLPALDRCQMVVGELDLNSVAPNPITMLNAMRLPDDMVLEELYKKRQWRVVEKGMNEFSGPLAVMGRKMKPVFVLMLMSEGIVDGEQPEMLDQFLLSRAKTNGQRSAGLETIQEQLDALDAVPLKEQAAMLLDHCTQKDPDAEQQELLTAYAAQDLNALAVLMGKASKGSGEFERKLITERNQLMAERMDSHIHADTSCFFLVGAAHLTGSAGLIQGLRDKGYVMEPVFSGHSE